MPVCVQRDIDKIHEWSKRWKLEFNAKKCHVMEMGKSKTRPTGEYKVGEEVIRKSREEKDLGVIVQDSLTPEWHIKHIKRMCGSTHRMLTNIRVVFHYMDKDMMKKIISTMIRPRLEYAAVVWSPHKKKDVTKIKRIKLAASKMVLELKDLTYEERLKEMELPILQARRERGDLIMMYKIVNRIDKIDK